MNLNIVSAILGKELAETLRDKRTLMAMIGLPLLLYPAMILIVGQAATLQRTKMEAGESKVAVAGEGAATARDWIAALEKVVIVESSNPKVDLRTGEIDALVTAPGEVASLDAETSANVGIEYDSTEPRSRQALDRLQEGLKKVTDRLLEERLARAGLTREFTQPVKVVEHNVAPPAKRAGFLLGTLLPLMMIVMIGIGAFYPAVDLTAGEKERGTFETLLSTPALKTEIVCAKFLAVICLALLTGLLNLISMAATLGFQLSQAAKLGGDVAGFSLSAIQISPTSAAVMLAVLIPLTVFIGAAMMSIAIFARDFKEANNYVAPFFLVIMIPGALAGLPGVELTRVTACIPITNVALLFRELLTQKASVELAFVVFISTAAYAMLTLVAAVKLFQSEDIVLSQEKGIPLSLRRSQFVPRSAPTAGLALGLYGLCLLLFFYAGSYVQQREIISGMFITQWLLLLAPTVALLWFVRVDLRSALSLRRFSLAALPAGLLLWAGTFVFVIQFSIWQRYVLPPPTAFEQQIGDILRTDGSAWQTLVLVLAIALSPAICEEVLFRGAIFSGIRSQMSGLASVLIVGALFGIFHVTIHRIGPTAILGVAITYLVYRSGSIYPGMLFHLLNNALGVVAGNEALPEPVIDFMNRAEREEGFPLWLLFAAVVSVGLGVVMLERIARRRKLSNDPGAPAAEGVFKLGERDL